MSLGDDVHSYSNFKEIVTKHVYPRLFVDFNRKIFYGSVTMTLERKQANATFVRFDIRGLCIEQVTAKGVALPWTIPKFHATLGSCLEIDVSTVKDTTFEVVITYSTSKDLSGGIQWFTPEQTKGKKHPFVYTQFEAILSRSMIPTQDTPAVKAPYTIEVTCPAPLVVVASGRPVGKPVSSVPYADGQEWHTYKFDQPVPIPSYLIAVACGALVERRLGDHSSVWAEEPLADIAKYEYEETEKFLQAAEKIAGMDYVPTWGTYGLLVLPGAFPYGGMENPNLTFVSSSIITGDRGLVDVVAHEIAHSWSGNLITNSSWSDFWLNEGFTMYMERLIIGEMHGENMRQLHALLGYQDLQKTVAELEETPEFLKLRPNMTGVDPDEAFSRIPYEKGCMLLFHLEQLVGGKDHMISWLRKYFKDFKDKSLTSEEMVAHFEAFFPDVKVDWKTWFYGTTLPTEIFDPIKVLDKSLFSAAEALANKWKTGGEGAAASDLSWDVSLTMCFIDILINEKAKLSAADLKKMQDVYNLSNTTNVEVMIRWIMLNLQNENLEYIFPIIEDFVAKHGRGVYLRPIYNTLIKLSTDGKVQLGEVKRIYQKNRSFYHSVITNTFNNRLG